jgi:putative nucleotidyltransferase with HDIG domain
VTFPSRPEAFAILSEHTRSESLIKHALAVEGSMRWYAARAGEDVEAWGVAGLLHDFDYEMYPSLEDHPFRGAEILRSRGIDEQLIQTILSHAPHTGVEPVTPMQKTLFAVDELSGFLTAVALVRPSKKLGDVEPSSVKKKLKDKAFARNVSREDIRRGSELLGITEDEHIANVLAALKTIAPDLGL